MTSRHTTANLPSHIRPSSGLALHSSSASNLQTRINEKRAELESLKQLRDLSAGLAGQMQQLEDRMSTLADGTEKVAAVMGNWNAVLRAVYMASAGLPKAKDEDALPQTLVRIPIEQAEAAQAQQQEQTQREGE